MIEMKIDEYRNKMKTIGWSDQQIVKLVNIYTKTSKTDDGTMPLDWRVGISCMFFTFYNYSTRIF